MEEGKLIQQLDELIAHTEKTLETLREMKKAVSGKNVVRGEVSAQEEPGKLVLYTSQTSYHLLCIEALKVFYYDSEVEKIFFHSQGTTYLVRRTDFNRIPTTEQGLESGIQRLKAEHAAQDTFEAFNNIVKGGGFEQFFGGSPKKL